jgi:hypothetical protein
MLIAVDFDGTIVEHRYPAIGRELPFATDTLRRLTADGHRLILWTVREGQLLDEALEWCKERGVTFYAVNRDYPEQEFGEGVARKIKVDVVIDDRNLGGLPEWGVIYDMITRRISYRDYLLEAIGRSPERKHRKWWQR